MSILTEDLPQASQADDVDLRALLREDIPEVRRIDPYGVADIAEVALVQ